MFGQQLMMHQLFFMFKELAVNCQPVSLTCITWKLFQHSLCRVPASVTQSKVTSWCSNPRFSNAFNMLPHNAELSNIEYYGIDGKHLNWLSNYLKNSSRGHVIQPCGCSFRRSTRHSSWLHIYLLHINDLSSTIYFKVIFFADNCLIYRVVNSIKDQDTQQMDLNLWE